MWLDRMYRLQFSAHLSIKHRGLRHRTLMPERSSGAFLSWEEGGGSEWPRENSASNKEQGTYGGQEGQKHIETDRALEPSAHRQFAL
jgi:hypothetical protein